METRAAFLSRAAAQEFAALMTRVAQFRTRVLRTLELAPEALSTGDTLERLTNTDARWHCMPSTVLDWQRSLSLVTGAGQDHFSD